MPVFMFFPLATKSVSIIEGLLIKEQQEQFEEIKKTMANFDITDIQKLQNNQKQRKANKTTYLETQITLKNMSNKQQKIIINCKF